MIQRNGLILLWAVVAANVGLIVYSWPVISEVWIAILSSSIVITVGLILIPRAQSTLKKAFAWILIGLGAITLIYSDIAMLFFVRTE